jgi:hypothetical protein
MYQEDGRNASKQVCDALDRLLTAPPTSEQGQRVEATEREAVPMANPSWKQLAAIPESLTKRAVLHALGIEPPPAGVSDRCDLDGIVFRVGELGLIVEEGSTAYFFSAPEALKCFVLGRGTPSGDLARWWLRAKNLLPAVVS